MPLLSVVVPVRDRPRTTLINCLRSLRWQRCDPAAIEIVLSDYGSDAEHAAAMVDLAARFEARVTRHDERGDWNRSRALNFGIQAAQGRYVLSTDADVIFAPDFLPAILDVHERLPDRALVLCAVLDLPRSVPAREWELGDFPALRAAARPRWVLFPSSLGTGACQSASREFFFRVRGYDERYVHWGSEDSDLRDRACAFGLEPVWISHRTSMLHQWHPTRRYTRLLQNRKNALRHFLTRGRIVRNPTGWGDLG